MQVAKAGYLLRLSGIMRKWKPCWFVLYANGEFHFWETEQGYRDGQQSHGKVMVREEVKLIIGGHACNTEAPETRSKDCLIGLKRKGGDHTVYLCAESADDMAAWMFMLEEARSVQQEGPSASNTSFQSAGPPPYAAAANYQPAPAGGYAQPVASNANPPYPVQPGSAPYPVQPGYNYYYPPAGVTYVQPGATYIYPQTPQTIIVGNDYCYGPRYCYDGDYMVGGMALGMATGAMMGAALSMPFWFF